MALGAGGFASHHYDLWPFQREEQTQAPPPVEVRTAEVRAEDLPISFVYTATIVSPLDAEIRARVTGVVTERPVRPGAEVREGDVLFRLDARPFEVALTRARAQLAQARATLEFASGQVNRYTPLAQRGFASGERLDQTERDRGTASAEVATAEAEIRQQELNLGYAVIRAPFAGRAGLTDVDVGDLVSADQTSLVTVAQLDPIEVQIAVSSDDMDAVRAGVAGGRQPRFLLLRSDGTPMGREAQITKLDNRFNPRTARLLVRAALPNPNRDLLPGDFVRVRIETGTRKRVLVPTVALSTRLNQRIVYVVEDGKTVRSRPVETEEEFGDRTAVRGLDAGVPVAVNNLQRLRDGQEIQPQPSDRPQEEGTGISRNEPPPRRTPS